MLLQASTRSAQSSFLWSSRSILSLSRFVGIGVDDVPGDHSVLFNSCARLLEGDITAKVLAAELAQTREGASVYGSRLGRRHADRGLGFDEECDAEGQLGRFASRMRRRWPEAVEPAHADPNARLHRKGQGKKARPSFMVDLWRTGKLLE
ncbi:hypothetical protein ABID19_005933 [Mesorhizobium robiniae]|uniref:Transposase n=1 Tax=Mesorhizobium robiniae TaxID=559315 RepID=A0ABV2GX62_9HYPH